MDLDRQHLKPYCSSAERLAREEVDVSGARLNTPKRMANEAPMSDRRCCAIMARPTAQADARGGRFLECTADRLSISAKLSVEERRRECVARLVAAKVQSVPGSAVFAAIRLIRIVRSAKARTSRNTCSALSVDTA